MVRLLLTSALLILIAGCNLENRRGRGIENGNATPKISPMPSNSSPLIAGPIIYVALGDSTGAGIGATEGGYVARLFKRIIQHRPGSKLINLCASGVTTTDVLRDQVDRSVEADPQLVTVGIGINDIGHGVSLEHFSRNYEEILSRLKNNTRAIVVVTNIPDISSAPQIPQAIRSEHHQLIVEFNQKVEEIASGLGVIVCDIYTITHEQLPSHPEYFSADGFHPSDKGYELWAEHMWPTIAKVIGADTGRKP